MPNGNHHDAEQHKLALDFRIKTEAYHQLAQVAVRDRYNAELQMQMSVALQEANHAAVRLQEYTGKTLDWLVE